MLFLKYQEQQVDLIEHYNHFSRGEKRINGFRYFTLLAYLLYMCI